MGGSSSYRNETLDRPSRSEYCKALHIREIEILFGILIYCIFRKVAMEGTAAGWSTLMLDGMNDLRNQSAFTDVTLVAIDGSIINAHSLVLAAGSGHFKDVSSSSSFQNNNKSNKTGLSTEQVSFNAR